MSEVTELNNQIKDLMPFIKRVVRANFKDNLDIEDAVQEVLIILLRNQHMLSRELPVLKKWLSVTIKYHFYKFFSKRQPITYSLEVSNESYLTTSEGVSVTLPGRNNEIVSFETNYFIDFCLKKLTQKQRLFLLFIMNDFTYLEISTTLGIPISSIKSALHSARKKLKKVSRYI
ncbi:MAG: sigma-70 family RNA polymerase sigma factor [Candidatus Parvarchaeum sp.]